MRPMKSGSEITAVCVSFFGIVVPCSKMKRPHSRTRVNVLDKFKSDPTFLLTFVRHFVDWPNTSLPSQNDML